jgi:hypothetical protein
MGPDGPGKLRAAGQGTARSALRIVQFSPSMGELCGVALFADSLASALSAVGADVRTKACISSPVDAHLLLVQYHDELITDGDLGSLLRRARKPAIIMAHSAGLAARKLGAAGVMAMAADVLEADAELPTLIFPHPAFVPAVLCDRSEVRQRIRLPSDRKIVATCGFLRFERELPDILARLLPGASALGWQVLLVTSPWRLPSPGLLDAIGVIGDRYSSSFWHRHEHMSERALNDHLRASDLLWCWTRACYGAPYASGVISQMYGSGTRIIAADRPAHEHVLRLPNVIRAPVTMDGFVSEVLRQMAEGRTATHDPAPVSWGRVADQIVGFLSQFIERR